MSMVRGLAPLKLTGAVFGVFLKQTLAGKPFTTVGDDTQARDFTFVTDVAAAFPAAAESEVSGGTYSVKRLAELHVCRYRQNQQAAGLKTKSQLRGGRTAGTGQYRLWERRSVVGQGLYRRGDTEVVQVKDFDNEISPFIINS